MFFFCGCDVKVSTSLPSYVQDHNVGGEVVFLSVSKMDVQHFRLEI